MNDDKEQKLSVPVNENDHVRGREDSPVTVVKYGDYECPDCHRAHRIWLELVRPLEKHVRYVYRHFPLLNIHPRALPSAEASEAAASQGKFWNMHELLFINPNKLEDKHLRAHAKDIGLDMKQFERELEEGIHREKIRRAYQQGLINGITGTPTFYINGIRYNDSDMKKMVDYVKTLIGQKA